MKKKTEKANEREHKRVISLKEEEEKNKHMHAILEYTSNKRRTEKELIV